MSDEATRCRHEREDGTRCGTSFGLCPECGRCWNHCEHREEERTEAARRGAKRSHEVQRRGKGLELHELPPLTSHAAAEAWTDAIGRAAATGRLSAAAANAALRAVKEWRESRSSGAVSDRLDALTDALAEWRKTGDPKPVLELVEGGDS